MLLTKQQMELIEGRAKRDYTDMPREISVNDVHNLLSHIAEMEKLNEPK